MNVRFFDPTRAVRASAAEFSDALGDVLKGGSYILGESVRRVEDKLRDRFNAPTAVAVASGTDALYLALTVAGVRPGDEVVTTPLSFFATAAAIVKVGAVPVFADVSHDSWNLDPEHAGDAISNRTRAILAVHLFGSRAGSAALSEIARANGVALVVDGAHSFAREAEPQTRDFGDVAALSFHPTKPLGAFGDGGAVISFHASDEVRLRKLRSHGSADKRTFEEIGINSRLDELQAAALLVKLEHLDRSLYRRADIADEYRDALRNTPLRFLAFDRGRDVAAYVTVDAGADRDSLRVHLSRRHVETQIYYQRPMHLQPALADLGYRPGSMPVAEAAAETTLSLPCYPELTDGELTEVVDSVREFFAP